MWTRILIHHSAGHDTPELDTAAISRYHVEGHGWRAIGYNALVEQILGGYHVVMGRPLTIPGAHCPGRNRDSIGVCLVGNFELAHPPRDQLRCAADFLAGLCLLAGIPVERIERHSDHRATACPGKWLDIELLRSMVADRLASAEISMPNQGEVRSADSIG